MTTEPLIELEHISDPLVLAFMIRPGIFHLGGRLDPLSIRDQTLRAEQIVRRLSHHKILDRDASLGIVGSGPTGLAAASVAHQLGIPCRLFHEGQMCSRLSSGTQRHIDPTQYDWPNPWWEDPVWPPQNTVPHADATLRWNAGSTPSVVTRMTQDFPSAGPNAVRLHEQRIVDISDAPPMLETESGDRYSFTIIMVCVGFGRERTWMQGNEPCGVVTPGFWDQDSLETTAQERVLISGGGDGALQDFLRARTGAPSARALYGAMDLARVFAERRSRGHEDLRHIGSLLDRTNRAHSWSHDSQLQHVAHVCHQEMLWVIEDIISEYRNELCESLYLGGYELRENAHLMYRGSHFTNCYGLNRFLVLLLDQLEEGNLHPHSNMVGIEHEESGTYVVTIETRGQTRIENYDTVMMRHGIAFSLSGGRELAQRLRELEEHPRGSRYATPYMLYRWPQ